MPQKRSKSKKKLPKTQIKGRFLAKNNAKQLIGNRFFHVTVTTVVLMFLGSVVGLKLEYPPTSSLKQQRSPSEEFEYGAKETEDKTPIIFSGEAFRQLYYSSMMPNTLMPGLPTPITSDLEADSRILERAFRRGYIRSALSETTLSQVDGFQLQGLAAIAWNEMKTAAASESVGLVLEEGYRSINEQTADFLSQMEAEGLELESISSGDVDAQLDRILGELPPPGFSRHHTGYTIDIGCDNDEASFEDTKCFGWLTKDNYLNAKKFGWIPSYPPGAGLQGPDPEIQEYAWVGTEKLYE